jgi:hypothetical protein
MQTLTSQVKAPAPRGPKNLGSGEKEHVGTTWLLPYCKPGAGVAASGIIGLVLTSLLVARVVKGDRSSRVIYLVTSFRR